jgi:hypothetical protein
MASLSPKSNGRFMPLDVDKREGFAIVVGFGPNRHGRDVLGFDEFQETDAGLWDRQGGGGGDHDLDERGSLVAGMEALHLHSSGDSGWSAFEAKPPLEFAIFLCGPDVGTVEVRRHRGVRTADVQGGPGWLGVVWAKEDPAEVLAFTTQGENVFSWVPPGRAS